VTEAAAERAARLERSLGDPFDPSNPAGFAAIAAADERREPVSGAAPVLAEFGLNAELVPAELGGRLREVEGLIEVMQTLARRDPSLALAQIGMPLVGAVEVWTRARDVQRRAAAELLLGGGRITAAFGWGQACREFPRLDRGRATSGLDAAVTLTGRCAPVADADRANALLTPARVDPAHHGRPREWLLVELVGVPPGTVEHLPRVRTVGLTGVRFAGVEFHGLRLAPDSVLDGDGQDDCAGATVLRTVLPAIALAGLDTALRLAFLHLRSRRLYGGAASDLPAIRSLLVRTFVDLLACDCLTMTAARMISRLPTQAELYSLASFCLAAEVVPAAMYRLSVGLGARFYVRDGSSGMFQKLLRDLKPLGLVEATSSGRPLEQESLGQLLRRSLDALGEPMWLRGALETLLEFGGLGDAPISEDVESALFAELSLRCEQGRGLGLAARQLAYAR
jgi:alkylation response protein AidB-like acyl-CoA dehydrogenase